MSIELNDYVCRATDLMMAPVDNDLVILSLTSNCYIALDAIGRRVLELIDTAIQVEALCHQLGHEFDATPKQIADDVLPFLTELSDEGIVYVLAESPGQA